MVDKAILRKLKLISLTLFIAACDRSFQKVAMQYHIEYLKIENIGEQRMNANFDWIDILLHDYGFELGTNYSYEIYTNNHDYLIRLGIENDLRQYYFASHGELFKINTNISNSSNKYIEFLGRKFKLEQAQTIARIS